MIVEAANKYLVEEGNAIQISELMNKIRSFSRIEDLYNHIKTEYLLSDIKVKFERYIPLVDELAEKQGKVIDMKITGEVILVDTNRYTTFINASIHLFRNMVDHGIETEDERIEKAKPQKGNIKVEFKNDGDFFLVYVTDDGAGIDPRKIKNKVLENGLKTEKEIKDLKDVDIIKMIFLPGLSIKEEVSDISGRGVGMDALKKTIDSFGGVITVSSRIDEGTMFRVKLPILI